MNSSSTLKDNEIINEIWNGSENEDDSLDSECNSSDNEDNNLGNSQSKEDKRKPSLRNRAIKSKRNKKTQNKPNCESSKVSSSQGNRSSQKNHPNEGKSYRKRKAQKGDSNEKPCKISCDVQNSDSEVEFKNFSSAKSEIEEESYCFQNGIFYPNKISSSKKCSAKKNLFPVSIPSETTSPTSKLNYPGKENRTESNRFSKNDLTPRKTTRCSVRLSVEKESETDLPIKSNKQVTPQVRLRQTPKERVNVCSESIESNITPTKDIKESVFKNCSNIQYPNELSPSKVCRGHPSPNKTVSISGSNEFALRVSTPQKEKLEPSKNHEMKVVLKDCNLQTPQKEMKRSPSKRELKCQYTDPNSQTPQKEIKGSPSKHELKCYPTDPNPQTPQKETMSSTIKRKLNNLNIDFNVQAITPSSDKRIPKLKDSYVNTIKTPQKGLAKGGNKEIESNVGQNCTPRKKEKQVVPNITSTPSVKHNVDAASSPLQRQRITVKTPISTKKSGRGFLTPSMAKKEHLRKDQIDDDLDTTRKQLHISTIPKSLPCRDTEFSEIKSFLLKKMEHAAGGCMYISGVPGTGKTATVHGVICSLKKEVDLGDLQEFDFVEVNGLRLTEPKQAYVRILQALTDKKLSPDQAQQLLNKRFSGTCKKSTVILVDELDYLCNRRQDVVYNILDWPTKQGSRLVVLTISNTMDLPERTLKGRVTSRMGLTRVTFQPYSHHQLKAIVEDRLSGTDTFHPDAVQLVARKVAAVSGDARRALDICRRTTELVSRGEQITVSHVEKALTKIFSGPRVTVIQSLCREGQLVLRAVRDVNQRTGIDEATVSEVYKHLQDICSVDGYPKPTVGAVLQTCVALVALGLIVAERGRVDIHRKMSLNVSSDDIHYALDHMIA